MLLILNTRSIEDYEILFFLQRSITYIVCMYVGSRVLVLVHDPTRILFFSKLCYNNWRLNQKVTKYDADNYLWKFPGNHFLIYMKRLQPLGSRVPREPGRFGIRLVLLFFSWIVGFLLISKLLVKHFMNRLWLLNTTIYWKSWSGLKIYHSVHQDTYTCFVITST